MATGSLTPEQDQQLASLLGQIQTKSSVQNVTGEADALGMTGGDVCHIYKEVKPLIDAALPLIKHLPHGEQIATAIQLLEKVGDGLCS